MKPGGSFNVLLFCKKHTAIVWITQAPKGSSCHNKVVNTRIHILRLYWHCRDTALLARPLPILGEGFFTFGERIGSKLIISVKGGSLMGFELLMEYGWVLLVLIALEGLLAADNALVLAIMVKHLPEKERKNALFYGLAGAFVFRFASLFAISFLVDVWQVQAIGALYLLFIALNHIFRKLIVKKGEDSANQNAGKEKKKSGFWLTVLKVEIADIAFAIDSILAAVALAVALPTTNLPKIGGMDGGHFIVIFLGGFIGLLIMRFAIPVPS